MNNTNNGREEDDFFLEMTDDSDSTDGRSDAEPSYMDGDTIGPDHETVVMDEFAKPDADPASLEPTDVEATEENNLGGSSFGQQEVGLAEPGFAEQGFTEPAGGVDSAGQPLVDADSGAMQKQIEELTAERDKFKDQLIRKAADLDNYRKRVTRDREDQKKYGNEKFAQELLPVLDNMERALSAISDDEQNTPLKDGVDMVYKQLLAALKRFGVESFESKGTPFDPQKHEAIQQVETEDVESGIIIDQFQKGYFIHDRLLRPAMVSVAKNPNE